jgi:dihydrofolate reductase
MRKVVSALFISLDGVTESPDQWQFDNFDAGMMEAMTAGLARLDAVLMGRVTYQDWAGYWPTSKDEPYASFINGVPKYVVSTTLERVEWSNSHLLRGNLAEEIGRLKQQPGRDIGVQGSPTLVRSLIEQDLLDELTLMIHPVVVNRGKRLFEGQGDLTRFALVESTITPTGVALRRYEPRRS